MPQRPSKRARRGAPPFAGGNGNENAVQGAQPGRTPRHLNLDGSLALRAAVEAGTPTPLHPKRPRDEQRSARSLGLALYDDDDDDDDDEDEDDGDEQGRLSFGGDASEDDNNDVELDFSQLNKGIRDSISRPPDRGAEPGGTPRRLGPATRARALAQAAAQAPKGADATPSRKRGRPKGSAKGNITVPRSRTSPKSLPPDVRNLASRSAGEAAVPTELPRTRQRQNLQRPKPVFKETAARPVGEAYDLQSDDVGAPPPPEASEPASPIPQDDEPLEEEIAESVELQEEADAEPPSGSAHKRVPAVRLLPTDKDRPARLRGEAVAYLCKLGGAKEEDLAAAAMELERKDLSRRLWTSARHVARLFKEAPFGDGLPQQTTRLHDKGDKLEKGFSRIEELLNTILERLRADKENRSKWMRDLSDYQIPTLVLLLRWTFGLGVRRFSKSVRGTFSYTTLGFLKQVTAWLTLLEDALPKKYAKNRKLYRQYLETFSASVRSAIKDLDDARQLREEEERLRAAQIRDEPAVKAAQEKESREKQERASRQYLAMCTSTHELRSRLTPLEEVWKRTLAALARPEEQHGTPPGPWPHGEKDGTEAAQQHQQAHAGYQGPGSVLPEDHGRSVLNSRGRSREGPDEDADGWGDGDNTRPHPWSNEESDILLRELKGAAARPNLAGVARLLDRERWDVEQQAELFRETARVMAGERGRRPPLWARTSE